VYTTELKNKEKGLFLVEFDVTSIALHFIA